MARRPTRPHWRDTLTTTQIAALTGGHPGHTIHAWCASHGIRRLTRRGRRPALWPGKRVRAAIETDPPPPPPPPMDPAVPARAAAWLRLRHMAHRARIGAL